MSKSIRSAVKRLSIIILLSPVISCSQEPADTSYSLVNSAGPCNIFVDSQTNNLIKWAISDLVEDLQQITGKKIRIAYVNEYQPAMQGLFIGQESDALIKAAFRNNPGLSGSRESFVIRKQDKNLFIIGSDIRGTVYGIFDVAERIGISPWKWWADVTPLPKKTITLNLPLGGIEQAPSVKFRGIFLNDEDWGLQPWAAQTFEPEVGDIGPKTYEKIFQLLLRLKANTIWPAMHPSTQAFFSIPGNQEMAEKYHIYVGTSHAEPMLRNNVGEWDKSEMGAYNYFNNRESVKAYWQKRVEEAKNGHYIFTMGMRGIHDSGMEGDATIEERIALLETIISDQRKMLSEILQEPIEEIPQTFIPYKEVLELYNNGLEVPEDITLMWTDDNYGYIRRSSNSIEKQRSGGGGVYYHLSYWGRPHDYLWLSTTQPGLIWYEMTRAYQNGAQEIWIANVGDIKPAEYNMEFFLDLAWDINSVDNQTISTHLESWSSREFGSEAAEKIAALMNEYYRLAFLRKPEYMGWSQTEPTTKTWPSAFSLANENELQRRMDDYRRLYEKADSLSAIIPEERKDAYFQLVEYPVKGAALMNYKFLHAKKALIPGRDEETHRMKSLAAYREIEELTEKYNTAIAGGKWNKMMVMNPRNLPVFDLPDFGDTIIAEPKKTEMKPVFIQANNHKNAGSFEGYDWKTIRDLGYSHAAVTLFPFDNHLFEEQPYLTYEFEVEKAGRYRVQVRCLPTHSNQFDFMLALQLNQDGPIKFPLNTRGRSEVWKKNVLRNAVQVTHEFTIEKPGKQTLKLLVNRTGIVIDQLAIIPEGYPDFYEIQVK